MNAAPDVSIVILTQRRPGSLAVGARSVLRQAGLGETRVELVVVDNDQQPSARDLVDELGRGAPFPVRYVHEPRAGVANARNTAVGATTAPLIAFLDDDEEAPGGWLAALLEAQARFAADVVFGPVRGRAPPTVGWRRRYLEWFFSRLGPAEAGPTERAYGCGDSLIRRAALPDPARPFAESTNEIGGEDDVLFRAIKAAGARFCWAPDAWVWEDPVPERLTLGYTLRRAFTFGQAPPYYCANAIPPDVMGAIGWTAVGIAQTAVYAPVAAAKWALRAPDRAFALDKAMRCLGKALWLRPFNLKFYGRRPQPGPRRHAD